MARFYILFSIVLLVIPAFAAADEFQTVELPSVFHAYGSALTPDSNTLFVVASTGVVLEYDVRSDSYIQAIDLRQQVLRPTAAVVAGGKLYVHSFRDIAVLDVETKEVLKLIQHSPHFGSSYAQMRCSKSDGCVYTVRGSSSDVTVIDPRNDEIVARIEVGGDHTGLAISNDGATLYVANNEENELKIVDVESRSVRTTVPYFTNHGLTEFTSTVEVHPVTGEIYVAYVDDSNLGRISVLSPEGEFEKSFSVGRFSTGIEITENGRYLIVGAGLILNPETGEILGEFEDVINGLSAITVAPDGMRAYVCNVNDTYIKAIEGFSSALALEGAPNQGSTLTLSLEIPNEAHQTYQLGASLGTDEGIALPDGRVIPMDVDDLLRFSLHSNDNDVFLDFEGTLDAQGRAQASIDLSGNYPGKAVGREVHVCFVTLNGRLARSEVRSISNVVSFTLTD